MIGNVNSFYEKVAGAEGGPDWGPLVIVQPQIMNKYFLSRLRSSDEEKNYIVLCARVSEFARRRGTCLSMRKIPFV